MEKVRVMHFVNQFFAGIGGEEKADVPVGSSEGPLGPGKHLQALLGNSAEIVVTTYCGDDYFTSNRDEALKELTEIARETKVNMVIAGPAFNAGRYGFSCIEVCHRLSNTLNVDCITGMYIENAGIASYKRYKDKRVFVFQTAEAVSTMGEALAKMAAFASKLAIGSSPGAPLEEGYIPRGFRVVEKVSQTGADRALDILLSKMAGLPFKTEIPIDTLEAISVAPPIEKVTNACLAILTTAGLVPKGNPDKFKMQRNTQWKKYSIENMSSMKEAKWEVRHGGYVNFYMLENPNYGAPLDVCKELEKEEALHKLYPYLYSTPGINGLISVMCHLGQEMVSDMRNNGVDGVLLVST